MKVYLVYFNETEEDRKTVHTLWYVFSSLELAHNYVYSNRNEEYYNEYGDSGCFSIQVCDVDKEVKNETK